MARRATSSSKTRTTRQQAVADIAAELIPAVPARPGRKPKIRDVPTELSLADAFFPGGEPVPAEPKRGRKLTVQAAPEPARAGGEDLHGIDGSAEHAKAITESVDLDETADIAASAPKTPPAKARRGRPPNTQPVQQSSAAPADQLAHTAVMDAPAADRHKAKAPGPAAARWDPVTGTATFDWRTIEQVAATDGANQAMARLLLAARAEAANSRWPF